MAEGSIVCVVNRTEARLEYMYNGSQHVLEPGENHIPEYHVQKAKTQNIVMGSEDPLNPSEFVSLVGVKAKDPKRQRDDIGKIVFTKDAQNCVHAMFEDGSSMPVGIERIDRRQFGADLQNTAIVKNRIPLRRFEVERTSLNDAGAGATGG